MDNVSVCIATYNGATYIKAQLKSILSQLGENDEIIISDDSSDDSTIDIIKSFADERIKILANQTFRDPIFNFEYAISQCTNDFIFLSDQDDLWLPGKVAEFLKALQNHDLVVSDCSFIDENGKIILDSYFSKVDASRGVFRNLRKNTYFGCCMAFRRVVLKKALPFPKDIPMHDIWLGFVGDLFFRTIFIHSPLTLYRKHISNASIASDIVSNNSLFKKISYRWNLIKYIPKLILR